VQPVHPDACKKQPSRQGLILGVGRFESSCLLECSSRQTHPGATKLGAPPKPVPGELHHPIRRPVAQRRGACERRRIRVRHVQVGLKRLVATVELIGETGQEVVVHPVVRIEDDDRLVGLERFSRQIPGEERTFAVGTILTLGHLRMTRCQIDRPIGAPIGKDDDPRQVGRVSLRLQITEHVPDDRLLVVGGNDHPEPSLPAAPRSGLLAGQAPQRRHEGVQDERQYHELGCDRQCP